MNRPARVAIEQYANQAFAVARDRLREAQVRRRSHALRLAGLSGNRGAYVQVITRCAAEEVRESILALADAYAETFRLFGVSPERWTEGALRTSAQQIAGGTASSAIGQIKLHAVRTCQPISDQPTGYLHREVGHSMLSALREGTLKLKRQRIKLENSRPSPPENSGKPGLNRSVNVGAQGIQLCGPDEVELLIEPYRDGYVWRIRNDRLEAIKNIRFEVVGVQSFDRKKAAFRDATTTFRAPWPAIRKLLSGDLTKGIIFVAFEGDGLRLGQTKGTNWLPWPSGDPSIERRWILNMRVVALSREWPIGLDLRWRVGTQTLELMLYRTSVSENARVEHLTAQQFDPAQKIVSKADTAVVREIVKKRGRRSNNVRRAAIHDEIAKYGDRWREHTADIFSELERKQIEMGDFAGAEIDLGDGQNQKAWTWISTLPTATSAGGL